MRKRRDQKLAKAVGLRLYLLRDKAEITVEDAALRFDVAPRTIGKFESGQITPRIETLIDMADFYKVSVDYILRGEKK